MNLNLDQRTHIQDNIDTERAYLWNAYPYLYDQFWVREHLSVNADSAYEIFSDINQTIRNTRLNISLYERSINLQESILDNNPIVSDFETWNWFSISMGLTDNDNVSSLQRVILNEIQRRFPAEYDRFIEVQNLLSEDSDSEYSGGESNQSEEAASQGNVQPQPGEAPIQDNVQPQPEQAPVQDNVAARRPFQDDTIYDGVAELFVEDPENDKYVGVAELYEPSPSEESTSHIEPENSRFYNDDAYIGIAELYNSNDTSSPEPATPVEPNNTSSNVPTTDPSNVSTTDPSNVPTTDSSSVPTTDSSSGPPNTPAASGSLIDEFADVSTEPMDFMGGDD